MTKVWYKLYPNKTKQVCGKYTNRKQQVVLIGDYSHTLKMTSSVPQGSILGPYLFNVFVSDLKTVSSRSEMVKFTDDEIMVPIFQNSKNIDWFTCCGN